MPWHWDDRALGLRKRQNQHAQHGMRTPLSPFSALANGKGKAQAQALILFAREALHAKTVNKYLPPFDIAFGNNSCAAIVG